MAQGRYAAYYKGKLELGLTWDEAVATSRSVFGGGMMTMKEAIERSQEERERESKRQLHKRY